MVIGVLALQGAFIEHEKVLDKLGISYIELRNANDLSKHYDAIILPGGESTVQGKLLVELNMLEKIRSDILTGMPVFATCAGLILLANELENDSVTHLATLPVTVKRNAYGRQLGSFHTEQAIDNIGTIPMTFIRAPYITKASDDVEILATVNDNIVAVRYKNQFAFSFHPELDDDLKLMKYFVSTID